MENFEGKTGTAGTRPPTFAEAKHQLALASGILRHSARCWRRTIEAEQLGGLDERLLGHVAKIPGPENVNMIACTIEDLQGVLADIEVIRKGIDKVLSGGKGVRR